jgi:tetratricopeptide (TPR) repeat protein
LLGAEVGPIARSLDLTIQRAVPGGGWFARRWHGLRMRWRFRFLDDGVPGHQLVEIAGTMRGIETTTGSEPSFADMMRREAAIDVGVAAGESPDRASRSIATSLTFVTPLRSASGDHLLIGRSFGLPGARDGGDAAAAAPTVTFVHPGDAIPYASVEWPGAHGVVSGINRDGIAVMLHPSLAADVRVARQGQPVALLARSVLEAASNLDDAIAILEHAEPLGAAACVIVDGTARTWAIVERSPERTAVLREPPSAAVGDILSSAPFAEDPVNDVARRTRPSPARVKRAAQLLRASPPQSIEAAVAILRDRRGAGGATIPLGHRAAVDDLGAVHTALFDPSAMVLWVSEGPGANARMRAFDLRYELRGEGSRAAPPPDIPAEAGFDERAVTGVREAREELRRARRARSDGRRARAREHVERALAMAPDLLPAHRLAGDLARARGDDARATEHYRRYLELGPDDLGAEQEVRAIVGM